MSSSGALFDIDKLKDVSKNVISRMSAQEVYDAAAAWSKEYDPEFYPLFTADPAFTQSILAIGRGGKKPRKDIALWTDVKPYMDFMFDELFAPDYSGIPASCQTDAKEILQAYCDIYSAQDDMNTWFDRIKALAEQFGFAPETKVYKANPEAYKGPVGDISMVLRVAICGRTNAPDLYSVMGILGQEKTIERLKKAAAAL